MTKPERADLMKMLTLLLKSYPNAKADMQTLALYVEALDNLPYPAVRAGIIKCMHTARFFPTVAEIRDASDSLDKHVNHTGLPDAGEAWNEVMRWLQKNCLYSDKRTPWEHPEVKLAAERFGITALYELQADQVNTARAQFRKIYEQIVSGKHDRTVNEQVLQRLGAGAATLIGSMAEQHKMIG